MAETSQISTSVDFDRIHIVIKRRDSRIEFYQGDDCIMGQVIPGDLRVGDTLCLKNMGNYILDCTR